MRTSQAEERAKWKSFEEGTLEGARDKYAREAEKRGFTPGMALEAPLAPAESASAAAVRAHLPNSWYRGVALLFGKEEALVVFERVEGLPKMAVDEADKALRQRAGMRVVAGDLAEEDDAQIAARARAVLSAEQYELHAQDGGVLLRAWVPFTELRPPAPPTPEDFGSVASRDGAIDGSCPLELQYRGGWYQVRDDA
jgi:hypothetical protein